MPAGRASEKTSELPVAIIRENVKDLPKANNTIKSKTSKTKFADNSSHDVHTKTTLSSKSLSAFTQRRENNMSSENLFSIKSSQSSNAIDWCSNNISFEKPRTPPIAAEIQIETIAVHGEIEDTFLNEDLTLLESSCSISSGQVKKKFLNLPNFICEKAYDSDRDAHDRMKPLLAKQLSPRKKKSSCAKRRYVVPLDKCGLKLNALIGYNGKHAAKNMVWSSQHEFFAFTCGTVVCIEDLKTGKQTLLCEHHEDISVLTLRHDCLQMASASACAREKPDSAKQSQIKIWNCETNEIVINLLHKNTAAVTGMSYSRDDRFLISIGDYKAPSLSIFNTHDYACLVSMDSLNYVILEAAWNPSKCNEFALCGRNKMLAVWSLDEKPMRACSLRSVECEIPLAICEVNQP